MNLTHKPWVETENMSEKPWNVFCETELNEKNYADKRKRTHPIQAFFRCFDYIFSWAHTISSDGVQKVLFGVSDYITVAVVSQESKFPIICLCPMKSSENKTPELGVQFCIETNERKKINWIKTWKKKDETKQTANTERKERKIKAARWKANKLPFLGSIINSDITFFSQYFRMMFCVCMYTVRTE